VTGFMGVAWRRRRKSAGHSAQSCGTGFSHTLCRRIDFPGSESRVDSRVVGHMKRIWSGMDVCWQASFIAGTIITLVDLLWYIMVPNAN